MLRRASMHILDRDPCREHRTSVETNPPRHSFVEQGMTPLQRAGSVLSNPRREVRIRNALFILSPVANAVCFTHVRGTKFCTSVLPLGLIEHIGGVRGDIVFCLAKPSYVRIIVIREIPSPPYACMETHSRR